MKVVVTYIVIVSAFIANTYFILNLYIRDYSKNINLPIEKKIDSIDRKLSETAENQADIRRALDALRNEVRLLGDRNTEALRRIDALGDLLQPGGGWGGGGTQTGEAGQKSGATGAPAPAANGNAGRTQNSTIGKYERIIGPGGKVTYKRME